MKLYVGLGNPGKEYQKTRHNVGFMVLDCFAQKTGLVFDQHKLHGTFGKIRLNNTDVIALKPDTFMNLSGEAVRAVADYYRIEEHDIVAIYDDMDLPAGKLRLRAAGSGGSHKGIRSIVQYMNTQNIARIRIGVGKNPLIEQKDYVLGQFTKEEQPLMQAAFDTAANALIDWTTKDFDHLMNQYNTGNK